MNQYIAFVDFKCLALGESEVVWACVQKHIEAHPEAAPLVFDEASGKVVDLDFEADTKREAEESEATLKTAPAGPGRPKLGVVAREVSLLPRHWEWLAGQTGGASATLRSLVETRMKAPPSPEALTKASRETTYRFLSVIAGNLPRYEDALRYLYRGDAKRFGEQIDGWPEDVVSCALKLAGHAFETGEGQPTS